MKRKSSPTIATAERLEQAAALLRAVAPLFDGPALALRPVAAASEPEPAAPLTRKPGRPRRPDSSPAACSPAAVAAQDDVGGKKKRGAELKAAIGAEIRRNPKQFDREIAAVVGCSDSFVGKVRKKLIHEAAATSSLGG